MKKAVSLLLVSVLVLSLLSSCAPAKTYPLAKEATDYLALSGVNESGLQKAPWLRIKSFKPETEKLAYSDLLGPVRKDLGEYYIFQPQKSAYAAVAGDYLTVRIQVKHLFRTLHSDEFSFLLGEGSIPALDEALVGLHINDKICLDVEESKLYRNLKGRAYIEVLQIEKLIEKRPHHPAYDYSGTLGSYKNSVIVFNYQNVLKEFIAFAAEKSTYSLSDADILSLAKYNINELSDFLLAMNSNYENYLKGEGISPDQFSEQLYEDSISILKRILFIGSAAEKYGIPFPEDYWESYIERYKNYGFTLDPDDPVYRYKCLEKAVIDFFIKPILPDYFMGLESV